MRQAGRVLPEYRALKERHTFVQLVQTPELAAEVTLQPIRRFDFDAAILFSDILVVPEALGQAYRFDGTAHGVEMEFKLDSIDAIDRLDVSAVRERLEYAAKAVRLVKQSLGNRTALLGFAGSPWTLANFMLEGGSSKDFKRAKMLYYTDRPLFEELLGKLTEAVTAFLQMQIDAGVDAIQIFDSLGGLLPANAFSAASGDWIRQIITSLRRQVPVIVFSKGTHGNWDALVETGAQVLGIDWTVSLCELWGLLPENVGVQGNLDPMLLTASPGIVRAETRAILREMQGLKGYIFNLGHGVPPNANLESITALIETVRTSP